MNQIYSAPAWPVFKRKLKEHYGHLTDAVLAAIESDKEAYLENLQRVVGGSPLEIARLAEEAAEEQGRGWHPVSLAFARGEEGWSRHWSGGALSH